MQGTQLPTERLAPGVPINPVVRNGILLGAIQLRRRSNHHPQARDSLLITLLILLLTRQHVSSLGPGDCPSESALIPKPLGTKASRRSGGAAATVVKTVANRLWSLEGYKPPGAEHLGKPCAIRCFLLSCSPLDPPCPASVETCQFKLQEKQAQASGPRHTRGSLLRKASRRRPDLFV